jgi:hypothetical protein
MVLMPRKGKNLKNEADFNSLHSSPSIRCSPAVKPLHPGEVLKQRKCPARIYKPPMKPSVESKPPTAEKTEAAHDTVATGGLSGTAAVGLYEIEIRVTASTTS